MSVKRRVSAQTSTFLYFEALDLVPQIVLFARDTIRTNFFISSKAHLAKQFQFALKKSALCELVSLYCFIYI